MPTYERYGDDHEVVERVVAVADSPNDKRLAASKAWKRVDEGEPPAAAPAAEAQPARARVSKPPAKEA
ncbi:hypothetical protein ABTZ58_03675 [Streptomyces sp. NPDC094143]|uniref:hypothetical protein n=1 Tax=unclassified Streptomyces TaxID=2593676 RepID=UPI00331A96D9